LLPHVNNDVRNDKYGIPLQCVDRTQPKVLDHAGKL